MTAKRRLAAAVLAVALLGAACSSGDEVVATVDGTEIATSALDGLHVTPGDLDEDQRVGSALVLILRQAFLGRAAADLGISPPDADIDAALDAQRRGLEGDRLAELLEARNETEARLRINAELDVVRDLVAAALVTTESAGFDLPAAELAFLLANAEVCTRQIQLSSPDEAASVLDRLVRGDQFADVAREVSVDPFVAREEGIGAGGDIGCSAPGALPTGMAEASLDVPLNQPTGPVLSEVGAHVIEIYQRTEPDVVLLHDEVVAAAIDDQGPELFRQWAVDVLIDIVVEVDESVGRWAVLPETAPVPTVVPPYRFADIVAGDA